MTKRPVLIVSLSLAAFLTFGCGGSSAPNSPANTATNTADSNKPPSNEVTNNAPTLTPVFKAYCAAMAAKDEAGLRKAYSAETLKYFEEDMKSEKVKSLVKFLEGDMGEGKICEVRNEVITGDKAVAEIRADSYPNGIKIEFVKENGEWKMTNKSPALDAVKPTSNTAPAANAPAANAAKNAK